MVIPPSVHCYESNQNLKFCGFLCITHGLRMHVHVGPWPMYRHCFVQEEFIGTMPDANVTIKRLREGLFLFYFALLSLWSLLQCKRV